MASTAKPRRNVKEAPATAAASTAQAEPADVDDALTATRKKYIAKGRNRLRDKVLPDLEYVIGCIPTGRTRTRITEANIMLLQVLDELQA